MPSVIIRTLEGGEVFSHVALVICGLVPANLIVGIANAAIDARRQVAEHFVLFRLMYDRQSYMRNRDEYLGNCKDVQE